MKKILWIIVVLLLIIGGVYYGSHFIKNGTNTETDNPVFGTTQVVINEKKITEGGKNYTIDVTYPTVDVEFIDQDINSFITEEVDDFKKIINAIKESPNPDWSYTLFVNYSVAFNNEGIFSLRFDTEEFVGGAHPSHMIFTKNYDLKNRKLINFDDIITNQTVIDKISQISLDYFKRQQLEYDLFVDGLAAKKDNFNHFNLKKDSISIYFPEYQIAPYVAGPQQIEITFKQLGINK